ncbi:MAG: preprotein translocase subunit SecE [Bacillota bacterium]
MNIWRGIKRFFGNVVNFLRDTRAELKKVVWPSWPQVRAYTLVVLFSMVAIGAILWGTDGILSFGLGAVLGK